MANPVYALSVEFVTGSYTNITSFCLQGQVDRHLATPVDPLTEGHAMFTLANDTGRFSPRNSASPYFPYIVPSKRLKLEATERRNFVALTNPGSKRIQTPDSVSHVVTGDLMLRVRAAPTAYPPAGSRMLMSKYGAPAGQIGWNLHILSTGMLRFGVSPDGSAGVSIDSNVASAFSAGVPSYVFVTREATTGVVKFFTSSDGVARTQLGSTQTSSAGAIYSPPAPIEIGTYANGAIAFDGKIYSADVYRGIDGELVASYDAEDGNVGDTTVVSKRTGELWSLAQGATIAQEDGTTYPLFNGRIAEIVASPLREAQTVLLEAFDNVGKMANTTITTSLYTNTNPLSLFTMLMSESAVSSFAVDTDLYRDNIPFAWFNDTVVQNAVSLLIESGFYSAYEDGAGTFRLKDRGWGQLSSSVASYDSSAGLYSLDVGLSQSDIYNRVKIESKPRRQSSSVGTVAWAQEMLTIGASESIGFWLDYSDQDEPNVSAPAVAIVTPVASLDWKMNTSSTGTGTDRTATGSLQITVYGESAVCSLFNGSASDVFVTKFQIRGNSVQAQPELSVQTDDSSSQSLYGRQEFALSNDLIYNKEFAQNYAEFLLSIKKEPQPSVRFGLKNVFPDVIQREVGDLVSLVDSISAVNSQWQIVSVNHEIEMRAGLEHVVTYDVRYYQQYGWFILDNDTYGLLDIGGVLGF